MSEYYTCESVKFCNDILGKLGICERPLNTVTNDPRFETRSEICSVGRLGNFMFG